MVKIFEGTETFQAYYAATAWCRENGYSVGSTQRGCPVGIMKGDFDISKWSHMTDEERSQLDGQMTAESGSFRDGPVTVTIKGAP